MMTRTKLCDRVLPDYTKGEEIFNMTSHIVGGVFGIAALVLTVITAATHHNTWGVVGGAIYGTTMILLYTMSSVYHGLKPSKAKKVMQVIDHCTIYLLIAGSYTPVVLCNIREVSRGWGWSLFGIVWGFAVLGIVFTAIDLKKYAVFSMICYLGMGWSIVFAAKPALASIEPKGIFWLLLGGIAYTIGAILYGLGKKKRYMHSIFHLFVLAGSILQFFCILFYVV
ncbi:MAG: hemolysin III family protein [Lachnospiraceae bacterium]|nr:hemolysin III family protein [Lachnospiraceae bacterium]